MTKTIFNFPSPFSGKTKKTALPVYLMTSDEFKSWRKKQKKTVKSQLEQAAFTCKPNKAFVLFDNRGEAEAIIGGISSPIHYLESAATAAHIQATFADSFLKSHVFELHTKEENIEKACIGWGLSAYKFDVFKKDDSTAPILLWPKGINKKDIVSTIESVCLIRNLVNTPANELGTDELAGAAKSLAKTHDAKITVQRGEKIKNSFPLIYTVGKASPRPPQIVNIKWGKPSHPNVTIVGKGIIYDTGGLNLKPGMYMRDMKKDMGGAAHALGLAHQIMSQKLPVNLRVLLAVAENSVAGDSFRPGDVITSRKGINVEINDTDAEGRLVVADALTYACEGAKKDKPELLIDFCTLTGAARVALGYDIPAFFTNNDAFIEDLRQNSVGEDDPIWPLPLWHGYEKEMNSNVADLINDGTGRAGAIHGALFLQRFIDSSIDWIHLDCYAWEQHGKPGRTQGGADTGMRAIFDFIKRRYKRK